MTGKAVVFDTNALPREYDLGSRFWRIVLRLCHASGHVASVPEIVVQESVNMRRERYQQAAAGVASASKEIGKYWDGLDVYVPDVDDIAQSWEDSIRNTFTIQVLHGDDAIEGLNREALRRRPAREGRGSRDAAIWLTVLRMASAGSTVVFVSNNTKDFGAGRSGLLHPELEAEADDSAGSIVYLHSLDDLVDYLAEKIAPPSFPDEVIQDRFRQPVASEALSTSANLPLSIETYEQMIFNGAEISNWKVIGSYALDMKGLAMVQGDGILNAEESPSLKFKFRGWVDYDIADSKIISVSVEEAELSKDREITG